MELLFTDKPVGEVKVKVSITEDDVDNIMVGAIEGGINYWGYVLPESKEDKPANVPTSSWCTKQLLDGNTVHFGDVEDDDCKFQLNLTLLLEGCQRYSDNMGWEPDSFDAESYDCIIQYALFNGVIYG